MKTRLVWLGLGAAAISSTLAPPSSEATILASESTVSIAALEAAGKAARCTQAARIIRVAEGHQHGAAAKTDAGGEGGEGSAAKADADAHLDPLVRFYRNIQLVRGHLLVGDELVKDGRWAEALPHFLHPVEELYEKLGPELKRLKMKAFLTELKALAQTVKAKNTGAYGGALAAPTARLDAVDVATKKQKSPWLPFAVETALETLRSAIGEYGESIEGGKFTKAVEYQDSRGFVLQAERLLISVDAELTAGHAEAAVKARTALATLKTAWPAVLPPAVPVLDAGAVASGVSKVELALGGVK